MIYEPALPTPSMLRLSLLREIARTVLGPDPSALSSCVDLLLAHLHAEEAVGMKLAVDFDDAVRATIESFVDERRHADPGWRGLTELPIWWSDETQRPHTSRELTSRLCRHIEVLTRQMEAVGHEVLPDDVVRLHVELANSEVHFVRASVAADRATLPPREVSSDGVPVDATTVQGHLRAAVSGPPITVHSVDAVPGVHSREVYFVSASINDQSMPLVIRRDRPLNITLTSVADEHSVMADLRSSGLPVPEVVSSGKDDLGRPFLIMRRVPGASRAADEFADPQHTLGQVARLLARLHTPNLTSLPAFVGQQSQPAADRWSELLAQHERWWERVKPHHSPVMNVARAWLAEHVDAVLDQTCVVHGDFNCKNLLTDASGNVDWIIDFELTRLGHPAEDIAGIRRDVETVMSRREFVVMYNEVAAAPLTEAALDYCDVWILYRNVMVASAADYAFRSGQSTDIFFSIAGLSYVPVLTEFLVRELGRVGAMGGRSL